MTKELKTLILVILLIPLMSETKELTNKFQKTKEVFQQEVVVYAGETAPISGVIVPEYNYREYQKAFDFRYINQKDQKYEDMLNTVNCSECKKEDSNLLWIPTTFLAGLMVGIIAR